MSVYSRRFAIVLLLNFTCMLHTGCARTGFESSPENSGEQLHEWLEIAGSASHGGVSRSRGRARTKTLLLSVAGRPYVVWADARSGKTEVYLNYYDGSSWGGLGGSADMGGISQLDSVTDEYWNGVGGLSFDAQHRPCVTWMHFRQRGTIYLKCFDGAHWVELHGSASGLGLSDGRNAYWPTLVFDSAARPTVAWSAYGGVSGICLRQLQQDQWLGLGGISENGTCLSSGHEHMGLAKVAADSAEGLYVAFQAAGPQAHDIFLTAWDGTSWGELGGSNRAGGISDSPAVSSNVILQVHDDAPILAWKETDDGSSDIFLKRWNGNEWSPLAASAPLRPSGGNPIGGVAQFGFSLAQDGTPLLVWSQRDSYGLNIYAARYTGLGWQSLSPRPGGISNSAYPSEYPSIAADAEGRYYAAWEETLPDGTVEIYLKRVQL